MQINTGALPLIMGNYASNFGINLYMYGGSAYTDGKNITIPRLNFNNADEMDMAFGYVAHECGHVRYSDFDVIGKSFEGTEVLKSLFNALEDTRIEHLQIKNWPGLRKTFNNLVKRLDESVCKYLRTCKNRVGLITAFFDCSNRVNCLNQSSENSLKTAKTKLKKLLPETLITALQEKAMQSVKCRNSAEVLELSREILDVIVKAFDMLNGEYLRKAGDADNEHGTENTCISAKGARAADMSGKGGSEPYQSDLFEFLDSENSGNKEPRGKLNKDSAGASLCDRFLKEFGKELNTFDDEKSKRRLADEFSKIISKMKEPVNVDINSRTDRKYPSLASVVEACSAKSVGAVDIGSLVSRNSDPAKDLSLYRKVLAENSLRNNIRHLVKGYEEWNTGAASSGKCLDIRRYNYTLGGTLSDNVFRRRLPKKALNTTVHLLVDISGSMSRPCSEGSSTTRSQVANHLALSLAMSLESVKNVDNRVIYFPGNYCEYEEVYRSGQPLVERATYFDLSPRGCTPLAQALLYSVNNMPSVDKYHRNIIIVITDGEPDNYQFARDMLNNAHDRNIEVYALRVAPRNGKLSELFEECVDISEASELPDALTALLADKVFSYA